MINPKSRISLKKTSRSFLRIDEHKYTNEMYMVSTEPEFFIKESYNEHQQEKDSWNN